VKVLFINCVYKHGSTGRIVNQISDYLTKNGVDNYVAYGIPKIEGVSNGFLINNSIDAHIHSFLSRKLCLQGQCSTLPTLRLISFIKKYNPDIIHLHNLHGHYLNFKLLFKYLSKSHHKVVWTFHDCWPMTGKCAHFTVAKCDKWSSKEGCHNCIQLNTYPDSEKDRSHKNFELKKQLFTCLPDLHIVTVSEWLKSICKRSYFRDFDIRCIHNGINTGIFKPSNQNVFNDNKLENKKIILFVSNIWNGVKGEEIIMKLDEFLPDDYSLVVVGKGSESINNNSKRIITISHTKSQHELAEIYSSADVFVCTSIEESCSLVVLEAQACGTPAIVFDSTGIPENVKENCGKIIPVGEFSDLLDAIVTTSNHKNQYSESCIKNINREYTIEHMCESYFHLYQEIMETTNEH
jgi:glycosyltransferase involved in cell wall biosynthesis